MPDATIDIEDTRQYDLKSLPEGSVTLRRLPYGKWLHRQEMALGMKVRAGADKNFEGDMALANRKVTVFEFSECIVDHNLTDKQGAPLDFRREMTLDILNPRVGNEIAEYIRQLHEFEADLPNSTTESGSAS